MPAPAEPIFSAAAYVAAHTAFRDLIDGGSGAGSIRLYNAADTLLATVVLTDPCGTVNGTTGQLTLTSAGEVTAVASGTAAYGAVCDGDGVAHWSLPCVAGAVAVSNRIVINSLSFVAGGTVNIAAAVLG